MKKTKDKKIEVEIYESLPRRHLMPSKYGVVNYYAWCTLEAARLNKDENRKFKVKKDNKTNMCCVVEVVDGKG